MNKEKHEIYTKVEFRLIVQSLRADLSWALMKGLLVRTKDAALHPGQFAYSETHHRK